MNQPAPALPARTAGKPCGEPAVVVAETSSDGQVTVSPGKVEIGQGIVTALAQIAADELDIDLSRVQMVRASTAVSPNEGVTSGSLSVQQSGRALRHACAERRIFLQQAAERLGVDIDALDVEDGTISGRAMSGPAIGNLPRKSRSIATRRPEQRQRSPRAGRWPGIQFSGSTFRTRFWAGRDSSTIRRCGNAARPRAAAGERARNFRELKEDGARAVAGLVAIVRDGNFAGVVSETEHGAEAASTPCARARPGLTASPCPTKTIWLHF